MDISMVNQVFQRLPEAAQVEAFDFIQFLASREGKWKAAKAKRAFEKIDEILDGDTGGWQSEEEVAEEIMADRRTERNYENFSDVPILSDAIYAE